MIKLRFVCLFVLISLIIPSTLAQESVVPDVSGMNAPQAAAALNQAGLKLGAQTTALWTAELGIQPNTISGQSLAANSTTAAGSSVDITLAYESNVTLRYDDNDFTLINRSGQPMSNLRGLTFAAKETTRPATLGIDVWLIAGIDGDDCLQVWSISRNQPKAWDGCHTYYWRVSQNPDTHFWTQLNGVSTFNVLLNNVEYGVCPAAAAGSEPQDCPIYLPTDATSDVTAFVEFKYTPTQLVVFNRTPNQWMPIGELTAGETRIGDPATFGNPTLPADISRLAPQQCLLLGTGDPAQPCNVIATSAPAAFWTAPFTLSGTSTGQAYTCPAATEGKLTICILPR